MDYGGWYDLDSKELRITENLRFVAAMKPAGGGRNSISSRYASHFNVINVAPYSDESMKSIFTNIMDWIFLNNKTPAYS